MKKFAVVFAVTGLMALAACGEKPAAEANNASNEVMVNDADMMGAANSMENAAANMADGANTMNAAPNGAM